jgi:two-component system, NtrC family, sensor kinase
MRLLADAACELPWLAPCAGSLVALTRQPSGSLWASVRGDPGLVLLLLRQPNHIGHPTTSAFFPSLLRDPSVLQLALDCLGHTEIAFVDWRSLRLQPIYRAALAYAHAAEAIAQQTGRCDVDHAWVGGLLAPLGWLAAATQSDCAFADNNSRTKAQTSENSYSTPCEFDASAVGRRLATRWQLPLWLSPVVGHLGLPLSVARELGANADHFLVVQLAVDLAEEAGCGKLLEVGTAREELIKALDLKPAAVGAIVDSLKESFPSFKPPNEWDSPASVDLLADVLRLALENRRQAPCAERDRLHAEVDALHGAVHGQRGAQERRVKDLKLRAMAELAAGAGHEINNPLAVISGQAQYLLVGEAEPARRKALQTIIGQTQRIHQTLTQLMQFARPPAPKKQPVDLGGLVSEVVGSLQSLADERQVRLSASELSSALTLLVDPGQIRTALAGMLRNAVEAAPPSGWASLRVEREPLGSVALVVEDSGPGPSAADCEHLFDPFYSGRKAGRGRGLGLPVAWQLARQHGGDVHLDESGNGTTRFVLTLPPDSVEEPARHLRERNGVNGCHAVA